MALQKTLNWLIALAGVWMIIASFVLGYGTGTPPFWDAFIVGIVFIVLGAWAALVNQEGTDRTLDWINALVGLWLLISPFVMSYANVTAPLYNDIIIGIIAIILGAWAALTVGHFQRPVTG